MLLLFSSRTSANGQAHQIQPAQVMSRMWPGGTGETVTTLVRWSLTSILVKQWDDLDGKDMKKRKFSYLLLTCSS